MSVTDATLKQFPFQYTAWLLQCKGVWTSHCTPLLFGEGVVINTSGTGAVLTAQNKWCQSRLTVSWNKKIGISVCGQSDVWLCWLHYSPLYICCNWEFLKSLDFGRHDWQYRSQTCSNLWCLFSSDLKTVFPYPALHCHFGLSRHLSRLKSRLRCQLASLTCE